MKHTEVMMKGHTHTHTRGFEKQELNQRKTKTEGERQRERQDQSIRETVKDRDGRVRDDKKKKGEFSKLKILQPSSKSAKMIFPAVFHLSHYLTPNVLFPPFLFSPHLVQNLISFFFLFFFPGRGFI